MWPWLKSLFARRRGPSLQEQQWDAYRATGRYERIRAKYDAALTDPTNYRHWANADHLSAVGANNLGARQTLRSRSRYEVQNNCHARGVTLTLANDIIGTGARLQVLHDADEAFCDAIETPWNQWADEIGLDQTVHTIVLASIVDGEGPGMLVNNPSLDCPVKLDVRDFECDLMTSPFNVMQKFNMQVDGIRFDEFGDPRSYHVLKTHPGDTTFFTTVEADYVEVEARHILHLFRVDRPGQRRGIPWTTPALPIFSQLRRFDLATLAAAEIAADFAMFISTDAPADSLDPKDPRQWDVTSIDKGMLTQLPQGYKPFQLTPTQPTTGHGEFTKGLLRQAYAALGVPYNIGNADFEGDSYAGGRMGLQVYQRALRVHRQNVNARIYNKIFAAWIAEAVLIPGYLKIPAGIKASDIVRTWHYNPWGHVDPVKEATATGLELANGTTTMADECAEEGKDYRKVIKQQGIEKKLKIAAGIWVEPAAKSPAATAETGVAA